MSIIFTILLGAIIASLIMLSRFYNSLEATKTKHYQSVTKFNLRDLTTYKQTVVFYLNALAVFFGIDLAIYIAHVSNSFFDAFLAMLTAILLIYVVTDFYQKIWFLAVYLSPYIYIIIKFVHPPTILIKNYYKKLIKQDSANVYDKQSLVELIGNLKIGDEFSKVDLEMAVNGLNFADLIVRDFYTPRKVVKYLDAETEIGTALINDLYASGFSRFPVFASNPDNIIGTLYLRDLVERKYSGKISKIMSSEVYDISENTHLDIVLKQFISTRHHLFIVKNEFGEMLGVITIEDVLEQLIGKEIVDESDKVVDLRAEAIKQVKTKI